MGGWGGQRRENILVAFARRQNLTTTTASVNEALPPPPRQVDNLARHAAIRGGGRPQPQQLYQRLCLTIISSIARARPSLSSSGLPQRPPSHSPHRPLPSPAPCCPPLPARRRQPTYKQRQARECRHRARLYSSHGPGRLSSGPCPTRPPHCVRAWVCGDVSHLFTSVSTGGVCGSRVEEGAGGGREAGKGL